MKHAIKSLVLVLCLAVLTSCGFLMDEGIKVDVFGTKGDVTVTADDASSLDTAPSKIFGDTEGRFNPSAESRRISSFSRSGGLSMPAPRLLGGEPYFDCPVFFQRKDGSYIGVKSYTFKSFKVTADIHMKGDGCSATILWWGGDADDAENFVDLATGQFVSTDTTNLRLEPGIYKTIWMQINCPAKTIEPDFGDDFYLFTGSAFSWGDLMPFNTATGSAANVVLSTYVDHPMVRQINAPVPTGLPYNTLHEWMQTTNDEYAAEFFAYITDQELDESDQSPPYLFLPLYEAIDVTSMSAVSFSFELFMKDLCEVYMDNLGGHFVLVSAGKTYTDQDGNVFYAPLPLKVSYAENADGIPVQ